MVGIEKILNVSLKDYLELNGKTINDYTLHGMHYCDWTYEFSDLKSAITNFVEQAPQDTEAVVNYSQNTGTGGDSSRIYINLSGIALIPKLKKRHNPPMDE